MYKCFVGVATAVLLLAGNRVFGQSKTATVSGQCLSFKIESSAGSNPNLGAVEVAFYTFDGKSTEPIAPNQTGQLVPVPGPLGPYQADYFARRIFGPLEYGQMTFDLPGDDQNGNGVPDFLDRDRAVDFSILGVKQPDWPRADAAWFSWQFARPVNENVGAYSMNLTVTEQPIHLQGTFRIVSLSGSVDYSRAGNPVMLPELTMVGPAGTETVLTGFVPFEVVNVNQIHVPEFLLATRVDNLLLTVRELTLNRAGNRYSGRATFSDGDLETSVKDYVDWVILIVDDNDSDQDGIPDLSDSLLDPPVIGTQPRGRLVNANTDATFTVEATGTDLAYQWRFNGNPLANAAAPMLTLTRVQTANAGTYTVVVSNSGGSVVSDSAVLFVNDLPSVVLTDPTDAASFVAPAAITLDADATDPDGTLIQVEFLNGANVLSTEVAPPYSFLWTGVAAGAYTLTARATDSIGAITVSAPVTVIVTENTVRLSVNRSGANLLVSWPKSATGYILEAAPVLAGTSLAWGAVAELPSEIGSERVLIVTPAQSPQRYFRLRKP
jgi:hypothetical protein